MANKERFNVILDPELVAEARGLLDVGQRLSPILNNLLKKWVKEQKKDK